MDEDRASLARTELRHLHEACARCGEPLRQRRRPVLVGVRRQEARELCPRCYRAVANGDPDPAEDPEG